MSDTRHLCRWCGAQVLRSSKISTGGWVVITGSILVAPFLCPAIILAPLAAVFIREKTVVCLTCGEQR